MALGRRSDIRATMASRCPSPLLGLAVVAVVASPGAATAEPAPEREASVTQPAAVVSMLQGPLAMLADPSRRPPTLRVQRVSLQVDLHPDLVVVQQAYDLHNPGPPAQATLGVRQFNLTLADDRVLAAARPLAARAHLDGNPLAPDAVVHEPVHAADGSEGGYELRVTAKFPHGDATLELTLVLPSRGAGRAAPPSATVALQLMHYAWGWAPGEDLPEPVAALQVRALTGVSLASVRADHWTDGAIGDATSWFWRGTPSLILHWPVDTPAVTYDALLPRALELAAQPPRGHVTVPERADPVERPLEPLTLPPIDLPRGRRAMLVPATFLTLAILLIYLWARRKTALR